MKIPCRVARRTEPHDFKDAPMPRYRVIIDWTNDLTSDSDEMQVLAKTPAGAISRARAIWSVTKGAEDSTCRLEKLWILTKERLRDCL